LFFRLKIEGLENIPRKTNFIIVANHPSYLDPLVVMAAVPRKIHCIALRFLYKIFWLKLFLQSVEALPIGSSSRKALNLLIENKNVGLFPEGGVSRDGTLKNFRRGAALLAMKTGRPIVPCAVLGTYAALPLEAKFPNFVPIKLKIGKPIYLLKEFEDVIDDLYLQEGMFKIRNIIKGMLDAG
jgi:1-acyl-sn-glycerol-3-phosphate acyltransferase